MQASILCRWTDEQAEVVTDFPHSQGFEAVGSPGTYTKVVSDIKKVFDCTDYDPEITETGLYSYSLTAQNFGAALVWTTGTEESVLTAIHVSPKYLLLIGENDDDSPIVGKEQFHRNAVMSEPRWETVKQACITLDLWGAENLDAWRVENPTATNLDIYQRIRHKMVTE